MKHKLYTSLYLSESLRSKLDQCVKITRVDKTTLLSVLCYKAGTFVCKDVQYFKTIEYQERGGDYEITPVYFFAADHEYMHANRLACKVSVSKLLACAMLLFLDEIMEKGINHIELAHFKKIQNSYKRETFVFHNFILNITRNDHFEEYKMRIRLKKRKT